MNKSNTTRLVASNTVFQVIGKIVSMSVTILATIIITRTYGKMGYGSFSLMQTIPALFFIIVDFGYNAIAARELSKDFSKAEKYFGNVMILRVVSSLLLIGLILVAMQFFPYSQALKFGIYISSLLILTQALFATTNIIFQVKLRYDLSTIGYIAGSLAVLLLVVVLSSQQKSIVWVNFSYVVGGLVTFFINILFLSRFINLRKIFNFDKKIIKYLVVQAFPLGLMFIFSQVNFKADAIMLSVLKVPGFLSLNNTEVVAVYSLPFKIFEVALVIPTFLMNSVYPILVRHMQEGKEKLKETFKKTTIVLGIAGIMVALLGVLFAEFAINFLGGTEFNQSIGVLRLLLIGLPLFYISAPFAWLLVTLESQKYLPIVYLIVAVFNFTANVILIPRYSFYASAGLTWISEIFILIFLIYFVRKSWNKKYA